MQEVDLHQVIDIERQRKNIKINICDSPGCARPGKLVQQFVASGMGQEPFVFRSYLCQWHLGASNRYRLNCQNILFPIEHKPDAELLKPK